MAGEFQKHYDHVRQWIGSLPGMIGPYSTEEACLTAAHRASKATCDVDTFRKILKAAGYEPQHRMNHGCPGSFVWVLGLPERQLDPMAGYATRYAMTGTTHGPDRE